MPINPNQDSLELDMRCTYAWFHGTHKFLIEELKLAGVEIDEATIDARGENNYSAWRMDDKDKTNCYLCGADRKAGTLCACFDKYVPRRVFNVNNPKVLEQLSGTTVVERFVCKTCGVIVPVTAAAVKSSYARHGKYTPWDRCRVHAVRPNKPEAPQASLQQLRQEAKASIPAASA